MPFAIGLFILHLTLAIAAALVVAGLRDAVRHIGAKGSPLYILYAAGGALLLLSARGLFVACVALQSDAPVSIGVTEWALAAVGVVMLTMSAAYGNLLTQRHELERTIAELAATDGLTGAFNKGTFFTAASPLVMAAQRHRLPLTALVINIDLMDRIHDEAGPEMGNRSLRNLGEILGGSLRQIDVLGRLGREKFAIVLPHTDIGGASVVATRIRSAVEREIEQIHRATSVRLTARVGVAALHDGNLDNLLNAAEGSIYSRRERQAASNPAE